TTDRCEDEGDIGSMVLLPPADKSAPFAFQVVTSIGAPIDDCEPPNHSSACIVSRRSMHFVPHHPFHVPVRMHVVCAGVECPPDQSCVDGTCVNSAIDPGDCDSEAGCDPKPGDVPPWQMQIGGEGSQMARHVALGEQGILAVTGNFSDEI